MRRRGRRDRAPARGRRDLTRRGPAPRRAATGGPCAVALVAALALGCAGDAELGRALARGEVALDERDPVSARVAFTLALSLQPGEPRALHGLARAWFAGGDARAAHALLLDLREAQPGYFYANTVADYVAILVELGRQRLQAGDLKAARGHLRALSELAPGHPAVGGLRRDEALTRGDRARDRGDVAGALSAYRAALALDPGSREAAARLAALLVEAGDADSALPVLSDALEHHPEDAELLALMVSALAIR